MIRYKKILFITIQDIWFNEEAFSHSVDKIKVLHTNKMIDCNKYDFKLTAKTFLLDISKREEEIFAGFEYKSCKYPINRAKRDGIRVWKAESVEDKHTYLSFQNEFCLNKEIPIVDEKELEALEIYCAETPEKEFLGGCAFLLSADHKLVRYKYGATTHKFNANEAILWAAICDYHKRGFEYFDFGGCIPTEDKESYYYRHYCFKKKFGGELIDSYEYFCIRGIYKIFYYIFMIVLKLFFHGDINAFTIWINQRRMIR